MSPRDITLAVIAVAVIVIAIVVIARMVRNSQPHVVNQIYLKPEDASPKAAWLKAQKMGQQGGGAASQANPSGQ